MSKFLPNMVRLSRVGCAPLLSSFNVKKLYPGSMVAFGEGGGHRRKLRGYRTSKAMLDEPKCGCRLADLVGVAELRWAGMIASGRFIGVLQNRPNVSSFHCYIVYILNLVDIAAGSMVEMLDSPPGVYHLTHPNPVAWSILVREAARLMNVPLVPYTQWLASLEKQASSRRAELSQNNPALKVAGLHQVHHAQDEYNEYRELLGAVARMH